MLDNLKSRIVDFVQILINKYSPFILLKKTNLSTLLSPWYHNFEVLGLATTQRPGIYTKNQQCKQGPLFDLINKAVQLCLVSKPSIKGAELFCADGFYSIFAIKCGANSIDAFDLDRSEIEKAQLITDILLSSKDKINYYVKNVFDITDHYDFAICAGGLYHISKPEELLKLLRERVKIALVIQTAYSLANTSSDYFESPVATRPLGCRFSYDYLLGMVERAGWLVIEQAFNELEGNAGMEDKGSAYLLCVPKK